MLQRKKKVSGPSLKGFSEAEIMGKRMLGGKWSKAEIIHKKKLTSAINELVFADNPEKWYLENELHLRAYLPSKDRARLLRMIAGRRGLKFKINEVPTEQELLFRVFGRAKPKKAVQEELF